MTKISIELKKKILYKFRGIDKITINKCMYSYYRHSQFNSKYYAGLLHYNNIKGTYFLFTPTSLYSNILFLTLYKFFDDHSDNTSCVQFVNFDYNLRYPLYIIVAQ